VAHTAKVTVGYKLPSHRQFVVAVFTIITDKNIGLLIIRVSLIICKIDVYIEMVYLSAESPVQVVTT